VEVNALSHPQRRIWFAEVENPGTPINHLSAYAPTTGCQDPETLRQRIQQLVAEEDCLRTRIVKESAPGDDFPVSQRVDPSYTPDIPLHRFADLPEAQNWMLQQALLPFDLYNGPLARFALFQLAGQQDYGYFFVVHHLISDGASCLLMAQRIAHSMPERTARYADFVEWERQYLQSETCQSDLAFWKQSMQDLPEPLRLAQGVPAGQSLLLMSLEADPELLAYQGKASLYKLFLVALATYLARVCRQSDLVLATVNHNRGERRFRDLTGMFVSTLPLRLQVDLEQSFEQALENYGNQVNHLLKNHARFPLEHLVAEVRRESGQELSDHLHVSLVGHPDQPSPLRGVLPGTTPGGIAIHVNPEGTAQSGCLRLFYSADGTIFGPQDIENLHQGMCNLLRAALSNPAQKLAQLPLVQNEPPFCGHALDYPKDLTLPQRVAQWAQSHPDQLALVADGFHYTYAQLDRWAHQIAGQLLTTGVDLKGRFVGLCAGRGACSIAAMLGILKSGAAYLPLDPNYPAERLQFMVDDAGVELVVVEPQFADLFQGPTPWLLQSQPVQAEPGPLSVQTSAQDVAYAIYTSGTTGKPKGVPIRHYQVNCMVEGWWQLCPTRLGTRIMHFASHNFDVSVSEIFTTLLGGGTLVVAQERERQDVQALVRLMLEAEVEVAEVPPAMLAIVPEVDFPHLKVMIVGGESTDPAVIRRWSQAYKLLNGYGPTECTVTASATYLKPDSLANDIGPPMPNVYAYVLDQNLQPLPVGIAGELYLAGPQVSTGYHNRPELTAERFLANPYNQDGQRPVLYKTGDRVRWCPNGHLEFIGRVDFQVKIRGHRIECGEVSNALSQIAGVRSCLVVAQAQGSTHRLVAYIVAEAEANLSNENLRQHAGNFLPEYMIPAVFVMLDEFPVTPNGKIDRRRLPEPAFQQALARAYEAPSSPQEKELCQLWSRLLGVERVGVQDDFFELGGDSLACMRMVAEAEKLGIALEISAVRKTPSIRPLLASQCQKLSLPTVPRGVALPQPLPANALMMRRQEQTMARAGVLPHPMMSGWRLQGNVDNQALQRALQDLVLSHQALRVRLQEQGDQVLMLELEGPPVIPIHSSHSSQLDEILKHWAQVEGPACEFRLDHLVDLDCSQISLKATHELLDAWAAQVLLDELARRYNAHRGGQVFTPIQDAPPEIADFSHWYAQLVASPLLEDSKKYWEDLLQAGGKLCSQPPSPDPSLHPYAAVSAALPLDLELRQRFEQLCQDTGCTPFEGYYALYNRLLWQRFQPGQSGVLTACVNVLRDQAELQNVTGCLTNRLYVNTPIQDGLDFALTVQSFCRAFEEARRHRWFPAWQLVDPGGTGFPDFFFHYVPRSLDQAPPFQDLHWQPLPAPIPAHWPLSLAFQVIDHEQRPTLLILGRAGFCDQAFMLDLMQQYRELLTQVCSTAAVPG